MRRIDFCKYAYIVYTFWRAIAIEKAGGGVRCRIFHVFSVKKSPAAQRAAGRENECSGKIQVLSLACRGSSFAFSSAGCSARYSTTQHTQDRMLFTSVTPEATFMNTAEMSGVMPKM